MKTLNLKNILFLILLTGIFIIPTGCKKKTNPEPDPNPQPDEIIIADNTKVPDLQDRNSIVQIDTNNFTFKFSSGSDFAKNLKSGDILVDSASDKARYGYLRKVKSVQSSKGEIVVTTEPAGLTDAILQGKINFNSGKLKASEISRMELAKGVKLKSLKNTNFTVFDMDYDMEFGSGDNKITVQGNTQLDMEVFFNFDWDYCIICDPPTVEVNLFESGVELDQSASININSQTGASINQRIPIATYYFEPWTFTIGPVPVVFVPKIQLFIAVDGSIEAEFSSGATEGFSGKLGTRYTADDGWGTIKEKTSTFDYYPPNLDVSTNIEANVGPEVSLLLYGVAGPFTNVTACSKLDAELHTGTDNWDLDFNVGVKAEVGIKVDVLIFDDEWKKDFCLFEQNLMHLDNEPMGTGIYFETPVDGGWYGLGSNVDIKARVTGPSPSRIDFLVDNQTVTSITQEPWEYVWNTESATYGEHTLVINDVIGENIIASDTISISLLNAEWETVDLSSYGLSDGTINSDVFFTGDNEGWIAGGSSYGLDGYVLHTTDGGATWNNIAPTGLEAPIALEKIIFLNEDELLLRTKTGRVITSTTWNDIHWSTDPPGGGGPTFKDFDVSDIALSTSAKIIGVGNSITNTKKYTIITADAVSQDFQPIGYTDIDYYYNDMPTAPRVYCRNDKAIVFNLKDQSNPLRQYIMLSENGGMDWETQQLNASGITRDDDIYGAFFLDEQKGWLVGRESQGFAFVLITTDGGQSWDKINVEDADGFGSIWMIDTKEGYATVNTLNVDDNPQTKLYHTLDGGYNWSPMDIVNTRQPMIKVFFRGPYLGYTVGGGSDVFKFSVN